MAPPKKNVKMDLGSFLADDSFGGSWADEEVDINTIGVSLDQPTFSTAAPVGATGNAPVESQGRFSSNDEFKRERKEFPIPDQPPYRARVSNLPWEVDESGIIRHFEDRMQAKDIISDIVLPKDRETGKLRGFAFITFSEREILEESLNLSMTEFQGRKIFVNVAAPPKESEGDWRSGRGGNNTRREPAVELDWGSARNSQAELPTRPRPNRLASSNNGNTEGGEESTTSRPPRRQEPELDWGSARSSAPVFPTRSRSNRNFENDQSSTPRTPRKQEPELDWGSARSTTATLPPRERSKRTTSYNNNNNNNNNENTTTTTTTSNKKPSEPEFDWKRGQALPSGRRTASSTNTHTKKDDKKEDQASQAQGPQKSHFSVLNIEGDEEDEEEHHKEEVKTVEEELVKETANLSVSEDNDGWEVVRK